MWNIATDAVINANLKKDGLKMPEDGGVDIPGAENCDAETMYQKLLKEKQKGKQKEAQNEEQNEDQKEDQNAAQKEDQNEEQEKLQSNQSNQGNETKNNNSQSQSGPGTHGLWDKAIKDRKKEQQKSSINDSEEKTEEISEKNVFEQNRIERKKQQEEFVKELAIVSSKEAGSQSSIGTRSLSDIGIAKPLIDWRRLLRQAIKYDEEYTRKNARMRNGFFRHRIEQIPMSETEIVLDVSGSVSEVLLKNFLRECKNILENSKVKVGCFDTEFHGFTEIRRLEDIDKLNFQIGGGTDFNAAVGAFSRKAQNKIIFTDGEAQMPSENVRNVIWVVFGDTKINPKGGKVINITGEQLEKLYRDYDKYNVSER